MNQIEKFKNFPSSVKNGIYFLLAGWLWFYWSLYGYFLKEETPSQFILIGIGVCTFVIMIKKWARPLCILCNVMVIVVYLAVSYMFFHLEDMPMSFIAAVGVVLFSLSTYYLAVGESSRFFKNYSNSQDEEPIKSSDSNSGKDLLSAPDKKEA